MTSSVQMNAYNDTEYNYQMQIAQNKNEEANIALICHGYLSASPLQPAIAFTLEALEFYHQLCRHQANFSVQAFIKVLCAIHNVHLLAFYFVSALVLTSSLKITYTHLL